MKTHLVTWFAVAGVLAMGAFTGCGADVDPTTGDELTAVTSDELTIADSYVTLRRNLRACPKARCESYLIRGVNGDGTELAVSRIELVDEAPARREAILDAIHSAVDGEVVLLGRLGPSGPSDGARPFLTYAAWRGLPGVLPWRGDTYYRVTAREPPVCLAPCLGITAIELNGRVTREPPELDVHHAARPRVDEAWLADRVLHHGALVTAHLRTSSLGAHGHDGALDVSQVFLRLPAVQQRCATGGGHCRLPEIPAYTRDAERCLVFDTCIDACTLSPGPSDPCPFGYTEVRWAAENEACRASACDPSFAVP